MVEQSREEISRLTRLVENKTRTTVDNLRIPSVMAEESVIKGGGDSLNPGIVIDLKRGDKLHCELTTAESSLSLTKWLQTNRQLTTDYVVEIIGTDWVVVRSEDHYPALIVLEYVPELVLHEKYQCENQQQLVDTLISFWKKW